MEIIKQLLGRLHPIIVHLPIGFILFGLLLLWKDRKKKQLRTGIAISFFWGGLTAVLACATGYLQYLGEGYAFASIKWHLWSGIATALCCFLTYFRFQENPRINFLKKLPLFIFSLTLFTLVLITGHLGGSITHGKDYLLEPLPNSMKALLGLETEEELGIVLDAQNWESAVLYEDIIQPILYQRCVSCHNAQKSKGQLQLHNKTGILKGGENGAVLLAQNTGESELYQRLILPKDHEDHMPPREKKQPTAEEIEIIGAWIKKGHPFEGSLGALGVEKNLLLSFFPKQWDYDYPNVDVPAVSLDTINSIKKMGVHVQKITASGPFLKVSCINKPTFSNVDFKALLPMKTQIAILDLGGTQVTDAIFPELAKLPNLTILKLDDTSVTGSHLDRLLGAVHLKSIHLTGSPFEERYFDTLLELENLENVYLYNTKISGEGVQKFKDGQVTVNFGNYELPSVPSDDVVY